MYYIVVSIILILVCFKYGDWKNWRIYYPTILYFMISDLVFHVLSDHKWLWNYEGWPLTIHLSFLVVITCIYPYIVILYLTHFPKKLIKQILYILLWIIILLLYEYLAVLFKSFHYYSGWNIFHSAAFDCILFPMLYLHYKKPLLAWPISFAFAFGFMYLLKIQY